MNHSTKGWVQYIGKATLYRIDDPQSSSQTNGIPVNWLKTYNFIEYNPNSNNIGPVGCLPFTYTDPNPTGTATLRKAIDHNTVAYWDCCGRDPKLRTKIEPEKIYNATELWNKVNQLVTQYGKIKKREKNLVEG